MPPKTRPLVSALGYTILIVPLCAVNAGGPMDRYVVLGFDCRGQWSGSHGIYNTGKGCRTTKRVRTGGNG